MSGSRRGHWQAGSAQGSLWERPDHQPASSLPFSETATDPTTTKSTWTLESKPTGTLKFRTPWRGKCEELTVSEQAEWGWAPPPSRRQCPETASLRSNRRVSLLHSPSQEGGQRADHAESHSTNAGEQAPQGAPGGRHTSRTEPGESQELQGPHGQRHRDAYLK